MSSRKRRENREKSHFHPFLAAHKSAGEGNTIGIRRVCDPLVDIKQHQFLLKHQESALQTLCSNESQAAAKLLSSDVFSRRPQFAGIDCFSLSFNVYMLFPGRLMLISNVVNNRDTRWLSRFASSWKAFFFSFISYLLCIFDVDVYSSTETYFVHVCFTSFCHVVLYFHSF